MNKKFLINASNLHSGGGVQVATSFISELSRKKFNFKQLSVAISTEIQNSLSDLNFDKSIFSKFIIRNTFGCSINTSFNKNVLDSYDTVFTIFGPLYRLWTPFKSIVGFAQAWIIYPNNECYSMLPFTQRLKTRLKYWMQSKFFKRSDILVVELEHVKQGLIKELKIPENRIHVIHNCISSIYLDQSTWQPIHVPPTENYLRLGFLGRNYFHKNTAIFPKIVRSLEDNYSINARFFVTFTEQEWITCTPEFRAVCINVGPISVAQCPRFYQALDAVVFPSLLECFSATPLEAMAMQKPLFASDRPFNHEICGSHAHYFDPLSPDSAAHAIAKVFTDSGPNLNSLHAARQHAIEFSNPEKRANKYLALLMNNSDTMHKSPQSTTSLKAS